MKTVLLVWGCYCYELRMIEPGNVSFSLNCSSAKTELCLISILHSCPPPGFLSIPDAGLISKKSDVRGAGAGPLW
jgi:hypothetical protein